MMEATKPNHRQDESGEQETSPNSDDRAGAGVQEPLTSAQ